MVEAAEINTPIYHKYWDVIVLLVVISLIAYLRANLLSVPLERDEGEYAYTAQLILQGNLPYADAYSMKMPGIYAAYALILMLFGKTHTGIHLGLLIVNVLTIIFLFLLVKQIFDPITATVACASFGVLSLNESVQGIFANAENFVILAVVVGTWILQRATTLRRPKTLFCSGLCFGLAFLIKQHGIVFVVFGLVYLSVTELRQRPLILNRATARWFSFVAGVVLPFGMTCLVFLILNVFDQFWFWTFTYAREYVSAVPFIVGMKLLKATVAPIIASSILIFIIAAIGLVLLFLAKHSQSQKIFTLLFVVFSWLAVCPGLYFRPHYYLLAIPSIALLAGICISSAHRLLKLNKFHYLPRVALSALVLICLFHTLYYQRDYLFKLTPTMVARHVYGYDPFPESLKIAGYIKENSTKADRIAVLGSEPQIYFYADRRAATSYLYTYPLMDPHPYAREMQKEMIGDIESIHPEFMVLVHVRTSWLERPNSEKMIFTWFQNYRQKHYNLVGIIDILSNEETVWRWENECAGYSPRSMYWLAVFRKKGERSSSEFSLRTEKVDPGC